MVSPPTSLTVDQPEAGPSRATNISGSRDGRPGRSLRARPSDTRAQPSRTTSSTRTVSKDEMDKVLFKLGPEGTAERREELIHQREGELRVVVDDHDMAVKEKFHLERYVSILEGWDPVDARTDNSPVFLDVSAYIGRC